MAADFNERSVKTPEDLHDAIWSGRAGITSAFALGYAQALYDALLIDETGLARYAGATARGALSHNLDFPAGAAEVADGIDAAAFELSADDDDVSDMLSALSTAIRHGRIEEFKSRWMGPQREGGDRDERSERR